MVQRTRATGSVDSAMAVELCSSRMVRLTREHGTWDTPTATENSLKSRARLMRENGQTTHTTARVCKYMSTFSDTKDNSRKVSSRVWV